MCTAPAFEQDMCMLHSVQCSCGDDCCGDDCGCGCDCCSPFIACTTCTGFVASRHIAVIPSEEYRHADFIIPPLGRIPVTFIPVDTPPPLHC